jgi:toxin ParE1/3/4
MKVTFSEGANGDLDRVFAWIAEDNPRAAYKMIAHIEASVRRLAAVDFPDMGRPGLIEGTRELIEHPYIIVYQVDEERSEVFVLAVVHGAKDR